MRIDPRLARGGPGRPCPAGQMTGGRLPDGRAIDAAQGATAARRRAPLRRRAVFFLRDTTMTKHRGRKPVEEMTADELRQRIVFLELANTMLQREVKLLLGRWAEAHAAEATVEAAGA